MTRDGKFSDFAIVHGKHGLPMPCDWLEYSADGDGAMIRLKPENDVFDVSFAGHGYEGPSWIAARGHGFILSQEDDYDVWLDFTTGGTVVSLRRPELLSPIQSISSQGRRTDQSLGPDAQLSRQ